MTGSGPFAQLIARRYVQTCRKISLGHTGPVLVLDKFTPPTRDVGQLSLF